MTNPKRTTIIIPTHNQPQKLLFCLESINRNTENYKLLIIDNDADPESKKIIKRNAHQIISVPGRIPEQISLYHLWNRGVRQAKTQYVAILNDDIEVAPKWLSEMIEIMEANPSVWCISPRYSAGANLPPTWPDMKEEHLHNPRPLGFCFLTTKKVIERMKAFDETYKLWAGDSEFFLKLVLAGHPTMVATGSYIHHYGSCTLHTVSNLHHETSEDTRIYGQRWKNQVRNSPYA